MTMKMKTTGSFNANRQVVKNQLFQEAFDLVGGLLTGATTRFFRDLRLLDVSEVTIATAQVQFDFDTAPDPPGVVIEGSVIFPAHQITSDVHYIQLLDNDNTLLAQAALPAPLASGNAVSVTRRDTFTVAPE